jgi:hypothetical protein
MHSSHRSFHALTIGYVKSNIHASRQFSRQKYGNFVIVNSQPSKVVTIQQNVPSQYITCRAMLYFLSGIAIVVSFPLLFSLVG